MLVVFSPIFVAETKIIYGYNFVAPLSNESQKCKKKNVFYSLPFNLRK